jgi:hypothetical protein
MATAVSIYESFSIIVLGLKEEKLTTVYSYHKQSNPKKDDKKEGNPIDQLTSFCFPDDLSEVDITEKQRYNELEAKNERRKEGS